MASSSKELLSLTVCQSHTEMIMIRNSLERDTITDKTMLGQIGAVSTVGRVAQPVALQRLCMNCAFPDSVLSSWAASPCLLSSPLVNFQAFIALRNKVLGLHDVAPSNSAASTGQCYYYCCLTSTLLREVLHVHNLNKGYYPYCAADKPEV